MVPLPTSSACPSSSLGSLHLKMNGKIEDDAVSGSVSGDMASLALHRCAESRNESTNMPSDNALEEGTGLPVQEDSLLHSHGFKSQNPTTPHVSSPVILLVVELNHHPSVKICDGEELPQYLKYTSHLLHLAAFGILGGIHFLNLSVSAAKTFWPTDCWGDKRDQTILYLGLPSNMVGSFLMGWLGVVFKEDISDISQYLAIGMMTGYLGSLTTFSGWNQKMIDQAINRQWLFPVLGFLLGLVLAAYSIILGVETAMGFRWLLRRIMRNFRLGFFRSSKEAGVDRNKRHFAISVVGLEKGRTMGQVWIPCMVGPAGKAAWLKWIPYGTLMADVNTKNCDDFVTGVQMGFLGCLSTLSTFIGEFNAMIQSEHPWHAYAYAAATIIISFTLGILIYDLPVWPKVY
ncbi:hypothetical protein ACJRO7_025587 [Eucalyptus globulus]|uniref:Uncharacterized protein n=1 Tax=Eucalyptus globulus TaxID=34317 RepID=A0ABD3KFG1_EUCGL